MSKITKAHACAAIAAARANPEMVCAGALARDSNGIAVSVGYPNATCFCIFGLVAKEAGMSTAGSTSQVTTQMSVDLGIPYGQLVSVYFKNDSGVKRGRPLDGANYLEKLL